MKKLLLTVLMSLIFCGVVTASSINGDYKGNPIVKVTSNGKLLEVDEVPAQIYDGHTVVPISLLRQLGASVTWNQDSYTVDIKLSGTTNKNDIPKIANEFKGNGYKFVQLMSDGTEYLISFIGTKPLSELLADNDTLFKVIQRSLDTEAVYIGVEGSDGYRFSVKAAAANDYFSGRITLQAFKEQFLVDGKPISSGNQPIQPENSNYTLNDALAELGITGNMTPTVDMKSLALELMKVRQTKKQSDYSVRDALKELGIPQGSIPTLATLKQAVELIKLK